MDGSQHEGGVNALVPSSDERTLALLAHLSVLVLAIIGPAILYAVKKDDSPFVAYHAMQALIYQSVAMVTMVFITFSLLLLTCGMCFPAYLLLFLPAIGGVMWGLKANNGEWEGYPGIAHIGRPPEV